ncbi:MAG: LPS export ABC transporter periplasmic protein LptC [Methylococcaceae bacterium]
MTLSQNRVYFVLAVLALFSWLFADVIEEKKIKQFVSPEHSMDFFSSGYYKKEMTVDGVVDRELIADKMVHYSDDGTTHMENPFMTLHNPNAPPWHIKSEAGVLDADGDSLLLQGQVYISRAGTKKRVPITLNTTNLKVKLSVNYAETVQWAELSDGSSKTQGVGLEMTFSEPIKLKFLSKVKGRYVLK